MRRHPILQMFAIGAIAAAVITALALAIDWFPPAASTAADKIDTLYDVVILCSIPIFVLVMTIAIYSVVKFRARPGHEGDGAPLHGNTQLELLWVAIPFVIVSALAAYALVVLSDIEAKEPDALPVAVTAQQFTWTFGYPQAGGATSTELVLPRGRQAVLRIRTRDVIHSFWVPAMRMKQDAVPGLTTEVRITPTREGTYPLVCAELCGAGHATMRQTVRVVAPERFQAWLRRLGGGATGSRGATPGAASAVETASASGRS